MTTVLDNAKAFRYYKAAELFAVLGLAFILCATESWRAPQVAQESAFLGDGTLNANLLGIIALLILGLLYYILPKRFTSNMAVLPAMAFLAAAAMYTFSAGPGTAFTGTFWQIFSAFHFALSLTVLVLWMEVVLYTYADDIAGFMTLTLVVVFFLQLLYILLRRTHIQGIAAVFAVCSAICYVLYVYSASWMPASAPRRRKAAKRAKLPEFDLGESTSELPREPYKNPALHYSFLCIVWFACGVLFNMMFRLWYNSTLFSGGGGGEAIQLLTALGTLSAAIVLLLLSHPMRRGLLEIIIVAFIFAALLLTNLNSNAFLIYLIPFNTAQKLLFVSFLRMASELPSRQHGMALFCMMFASYRLGLFLYGRIRSAVLLNTSGITLESAHVLIIAIATIILLTFFIMEISSLISQAQGATEQALAVEKDEKSAADTRESRFREDAFYYYLMQKFDLTQREAEILRLFEKGMTVKQIAESLVVSESTVKSHLSNVYPKLGVSTRKEVLSWLETERATFFSAE